MSNYAITVDTGSRRYSNDELLSFYRNVGVMQSAVENMKGSVRGLRTGIQRANRCFLQMGTAVRGVLSGLMDTRNVVDGLRSGMKNLYAWSRTWWRSFAGTLQSLAGNAVYLRNSLAAMAAPMLKALAPAIEFVTDKFVGLFNLINQFFARLTGSSTYVAARRVSGSIDGVGSSASHASGEVKELKRQLMGFDELNVLSALEDDSSGGGGGGSGGSGGGVQFEERQIDSALAGFVDALKSAFNAGDWQELGTLIGTKINEMVEGVDWAAAGSKVGFYINGLFSTAYWTLETVNFTNIGASVAEFLNNALAEIDFTTVGATVALLFTSLAETIAGFVDEFDWVQFAEKLADGFNGFVSKLGEKLDAIDWAGLALKMTEGLNAFIAKTDWANAGKVLAGRVNDLLEILGTASANFDWSGAGKALATAVNNLFKNVDWDGLGTWLNDTLLGVLDFGIAFFQGFDAVGFANDVGRALAKVDWDAVSEKLWTLFKAALAKLGEFFGTLLFGGSADMKLNLGLLKDGWETITKWLGIDKPLSALIDLLKNNWQTIAKWLGIDDPVSALVGLVKNGWSTIAKFLGIDDPVSALVALVKDNWSTIAKWLGIDDPVSALVNLLKGKPGTVGEVYSETDKKVTGTTSLTKGTSGTQTVGGVYTAVERAVSGITSLFKGSSGTQTVSGAYSATDKAVTGTTSLTKGSSGTQTVSGAYTADDKKVAGKTALMKGDKNTGAQTVSGLYTDADKKVTGKTALVKGDKNTGAQTVSGLYTDKAKKVTGKTALVKGNKNTGAQTVSGLYTDKAKKVTGKTSLTKGSKEDGTQKVSDVYSDSAKKVAGKTSLKKGDSGNQSASDVYGSQSITATTSLKKGDSGNQSASDVYGSQSISVSASLSSKSAAALKSAATKAMKGIEVTVKAKSDSGKVKMETQKRGGVIANGIFHRFARGGVISGGVARYLANVPHYAGGTTRAHGTVFVAGEAGPEIMGHINGRTEILNKSQLAQTMYSAVLSAMSQAVSALGTFLAGQLANCTNAIVKTIGNRDIERPENGTVRRFQRDGAGRPKRTGNRNGWGFAGLNYHAPVMASGTVLPYDVAAQIARAGMDIQNTLDANNEDLIQTIISVAGQIVAAVQAQGNREQGTGNRNGGLTAQQVIDDINRRAQMFGSSPILD
ncbi:MAG: hypothetical protein IJ119_07445 [Clostridia bacterium]|nr:hypothetical protein [Clostridia bacterium]